MNLASVFSYICGQQHCWTLGDHTLPFCQRCTGLYVGAFTGFVLVVLFRPRPTNFLYWLHGIFLLAMAPFGFHLIDHGGLTRTLTGTIFGFGLAYYFSLNLFTARQMWRPGSVARTGAYLLLLSIVSAALLMTVNRGGNAAGIVVSALGTAGLAALCILLILNLAILSRTLRILQSAPSAQL